MSRAHVQPAPQLRGVVTVPGDKSASHRALILSALAAGESTIKGLSQGHDVLGTRDIMAALGASWYEHDGVVHVLGPERGLTAASTPLDCGNSGTTIRLMSGVVSALPGVHRLVGDASLSKRPMDRVAIPLRQMGAEITANGEREFAPLTITGRSLSGITYTVPVPSAQVKSAILFAGLFAQGQTVVTEMHRTRTATEDMMRESGIHLESVDEGAGRTIRLTPGRPQANEWHVPCDPSQAAFFAVLGVIAPDATIVIPNVEASAERIGFLHVLRRMNATIDGVIENGRVTMTARSSSLLATEIHSTEIPSVDEAPILAIAASAATGVTAFRDMGELRVKESDRFDACLRLARAVGARAWSEGDDFFIAGLGSAARFSECVMDAHLDHRVVMSSAVAGLAGNGAIIEGADTVASSYPNFFQDVQGLQ